MYDGAAQNRMEDWTLGSVGCYDAPSLARLQSKLELDFKGLAEGNVAGCVSVALRPEVRPHFLPCTSGLTGGSAVCVGLLLYQSVRLSRGRCISGQPCRSLCLNDLRLAVTAGRGHPDKGDAESRPHSSQPAHGGPHTAGTGGRCCRV